MVVALVVVIARTIRINDCSSYSINDSYSSYSYYLTISISDCSSYTMIMQTCEATYIVCSSYSSG
jgi:hypothetical protein